MTRNEPTQALRHLTNRSVWDVARRADSCELGLCCVVIGLCGSQSPQWCVVADGARRGTVSTGSPTKSNNPPRTTALRSARMRLRADAARADEGRRTCSRWMCGRRRRRSWARGTVSTDSRAKSNNPPRTTALRSARLRLRADAARADEGRRTCSRWMCG